MASILNLISTAFMFCLNTFISVLNTYHLIPVFLGIFGAFCIWRFIISPLTSGGFRKSGGGKSDE